MKQREREVAANHRESVMFFPPFTCTTHPYLISSIRIATKMNWTGGSLQRTKTANGGVLQQQKAYFARARTHLQNELNAPVAPFQSRYLHGSGDTNSLFPLLGTDSNGNTGHARRQQKKGSRASSSRSYSQYRNRDSPKNAQDSCHRLHQPSIDIRVAAVTTAGKMQNKYLRQCSFIRDFEREHRVLKR